MWTSMISRMKCSKPPRRRSADLVSLGSVRVDLLEENLDEVESADEDQDLNINSQTRGPPKITQSQLEDWRRADKIKQLTGGVLMTESKLQPNYVQKKGQSLLQQADSIKKTENLKRFKDLDELNKVSAEQEQLIYQQKLEIKALKEDLGQAFKDLSEKDLIIKRLESRSTGLVTDQDKALQKMKKLEAKNESFKTTNMELRKKLQNMERMSKGKRLNYGSVLTSLRFQQVVHPP